MRFPDVKIKFRSGKYSSVILLLSLALLLACFLPADISGLVKHGVGLPVAPAQRMAGVSLSSISGFFARVFSRADKEEEDEKLKEEITRLHNLVIKQADMIYKLRNSLNSLSEFIDHQTIESKPVAANIIGYDTAELRKSILLDAGSRHGVSVNDTVLSGNALVGRISSAGQYTARVQLITDPRLRVPAKVLETRDQGMLTGTLSGISCKMEYVPETAAVKEGQRIVTSNAGGAYPDSIPIGRVSKSERKEGELFLGIEVKPIVRVTKIESVLVVRGGKQGRGEGVSLGK